MVMAIALLVVTTIFVLVDVPWFKKNKSTRDLFVWIVVWLVSIGATVCDVYKIKVPSPLLLVKGFYEPINRLVESLF
ncbi:hypothetical protein D3C75_1209530 [compost metagenome]